MKFEHNKQYHKSSTFKLILIIFSVVALFALAAGLGLNNWYNNNLEAVDTDSTEEVEFVIEPGLSARSIASNLKNADLIRNATVFTWYVDREGIRDELQAGTYKLSQNMTTPEIAHSLASGDVATDLVTIFPARRLDQIKSDLIEAGFDPVEIANAFSVNYDHPLLRNKPHNASLEGYIFPETYKLDASKNLSELLIRTFDQFNQQITQDDLNKLKKRGLNLHEAVILASIVAKESGNIEDRPKIASVFYNRLEQDMPLGSDATFVYIADVKGVERDPELDDPYNTRIYKGLPPGPISNFNFSAFEAVVNPADTDFLYFVSGDNGKNYFSTSLDEHEKNIELYCNENCRLPQNN